jgi:hypothetical protein
MSSETRRGWSVGLVVAGLERAVQELQQQSADEDGVVVADGGFGAGEDEHLAAFEDAVEVERDGVAQQGVDLARGDQPFKLVARRVQRRGGEAAVADEGGELAAPVVAREVVSGDLREAAGDALAVGRVAGLEQAVDVPERRRLLDSATCASTGAATPSSGPSRCSSSTSAARRCARETSSLTPPSTASSCSESDIPAALARSP